MKKPSTTITTTCNPNCLYFPYVEGVVDWVIGEDGLKHRREKKIYICGFDGHTIKNWEDICPMMQNKED